MEVEISSEGRYDASYAIVAVGRATKLDREGLGFVLERVVDHDHRTRDFGGVTERSGDCWSGDVHEGLWCVRLSWGDSAVCGRTWFEEGQVNIQVAEDDL